jgi:hypothetical protein
MATPLPEFPLDGPRLRQFMQHMWECLHDTAPADRPRVWQQWIPKAYEIESEDLMPSVEAGVRSLSLEFRKEQAAS